MDEVRWGGRRVAVVVPCLDEERTLRRCLESVRRQVPAPAAVVVVDSGSRDASPAIAEELADVVVRRPAGTIGAARNAGAAAAADADVIAFIDADCEAEPGWLAAALAALDSADLAGARVGAPEDGPWTARRWSAVERRLLRPGAPVWSANMALRREAFAAVGGFRADLPTGEDVDLCRRLWAAGRRVVDVPEMRVLHHGFPATLRAFVRRERWHGSTPGWWYAASPAARALVACSAAWALLGAILLAAAASGPAGRRRAVVWAAASAASVVGVGALTGAGREAPRDGLLLATWGLSRASRLAPGLRRRPGPAA